MKECYKTLKSMDNKKILFELKFLRENFGLLKEKNDLFL